MKLWIPLLALTALVLTALVVRFARARRKHDPLEYYLRWCGYWHPIGLHNRITREGTDALHATGRRI